MANGIPAREYVLKALYRIETKEGYSNLVINELLSEKDIGSVDRPFITELVYGVTSMKLMLDYLIDKNSRIKANKISPWVRNILRIGLYQILFLTRVPHSAACNESVKLVKKYGHRGSAGFVNAVLRNILNQLSYKSIEQLLFESQEVKPGLEIGEIDVPDRISILHSHPRWIVDMWIEQLGEEFTGSLCEANNQRASVAIRINCLKTDQEKLKKLLIQEGIEFTESQWTDAALVLRSGSPVTKLFRDGLYTVQDEAAMLVSEILDPSPGETVVDLCSAPGGKTTHIAQLMLNQGKIFAFDIYEHRLELVRNAAARMGVEIIETRVGDAAQPNESMKGLCDKVLVDAPCSGLGVIRRKPEIKWKRNPGDIDELSELQKRILYTASSYVKPGGRLVYSTCTISRKENEEVVQDFIKKHRNFEIDTGWKKRLRISGDDKYVYLFPNVQGTDGFFIASLIRNS